MPDASPNRPLQYGIRPDYVEQCRNYSWIVDNENWNMLKRYFPVAGTKEIIVNEAHNSDESFPVMEIARRINNVNLTLRFLDSFFNPSTGLKNDERKLAAFLIRDGIKLERFYGHLGTSGLSMIPHTVHELGLAICHREDSLAITELTRWPCLSDLAVCVNASSVIAADLTPLPKIRQLGIYFSHLSDENIGLIEPAIVALTPKKSLTGLYFPMCKLTAAGLGKLLDVLKNMKGLEIIYAICIELVGAWQPTSKEREPFREKISKLILMGGFDIYWDMRHMVKRNALAAKGYELVIK